MLHLNVQSISNCIDNLNAAILNLNLDVVAITEHWQTATALPAFRVQNFNLATFYSRVNRNAHGGVALYIRDSIIWKIRNDINALSEEYIFECAAIEIKINKLVYVVCVVYKPPQTNVSSFVNKMDALLELASEGDSSVVVAGDFNIDMLSTDDVNKQQFINLLHSYNLIFTINTPTRVTRFSETCIDNIFISSFLIYEATVMNLNISDHFAQILNIKIPDSHSGQQEYCFRRVFSNDNYNTIFGLLIQETWLSVYEARTVDDMFDKFLRKLICYYNEAFPVRKLQQKKRTFFKWNSDNVYAAKETLKFLHELYLRNEITKQAYVKYKNFYNSLLVQEKKSFYDHIIQNSTNKSKTIWNIINNETVNNAKNKHKFCGTLDDNSVLITSPQEASELFNKYYVNVAENLVGKIPPNTNLKHIYVNSNSIYLQESTTTEIFNIILNMKNKVSSGEDGISNLTLKRISCFIIEPLCYIINESLKMGIFPQKLKTAVVVPIYKKGEPTHMENHRPISMISSISKVLEIAVSNRLSSFLSVNTIISNNQHAYQENKSTTTATFDYMKQILNVLDEGNIALGIFIDLSKAFDCVNHITLLNKLERIGVRGIAYNWFQSYLNNRTQKVRINHNGIEYISGTQNISYGVPQGSILGPVLFLLYINDIETYIKDETILITTYADDTSVLIWSKDYKYLVNKSIAIYNLLQDWFQENSLSLNQEKTKCILFRNRRNKKVYDNHIILNNRKIVFSDHIKFLGVVIDSHMNWSEHLKNVCNKLSSVCFTLREIKRIVDEDTLLTVYYGHFYSVLAYGIILWGGTNIHEVFLIQKRAVRIIKGLRWDESCRGHFKSINLLTIPAIYVYECLKFAFKNKTKFEENMAQHEYPTRHKANICYPIHKTAILEKGCFYKCMQFYNLLPNNVKTIQSCYRFQKLVKKSLIRTEPYTIEEINSNCFSIEDDF